MRLRRLRTFVKDWVVPPAVWRTGINVAGRWTAPAVDTAVLDRNARFNDLYRGRRCFVIGNGPSISSQDLSPLAPEITITMNWFNRHPVLDQWKPTFHCMAEPGDAACWQDPTMLPRILDRLKPHAYFFHIEAMPHIQRAALPDGENAHYVAIGNVVSARRSIDLTKPLLPTYDTSLLATQVAVALGCSPIYLLGVDYDWLSHRTLYRHFYDADDPAETRENLGKTYYLRNIEVAQRQWSCHEAVREIAARRGQRIYNATEGGFLDVYPPTTLREALGS